ncbi:hypothetical protein ACFQ8O_33970 [Streptomyces coelicoflavus]|uniref:hypothetical protein n=1 Tax=Streptomyces coelicoflavus TaxID=285562 RepID=UPI0036C0DBDE
MADTRFLWWSAGRMAFSVAEDDSWLNGRWSDCLQRSATLLEPVWPKHDTGGPFTFALPTIALFLYAGPLESEPAEASAADLVATLAPRRAGSDGPSLEDSIRAGLAKRGHDLNDDSQLSALVRWLTVYREPVTHDVSGMDLPAFEQTPGGSLLNEGARWVHHQFTHHYIRGSMA